METIAIVGDGPGGLSAALFLAKAGHAVKVFGTDETVMHYAYLHNYLGIQGMSGSDFQKIARAQIIEKGAKIVPKKVEAISSGSEGFELIAEGEKYQARFLILSEGKGGKLAESLGLEHDGKRVVVDHSSRSSKEDVYVLGRNARPERSQAIISAGDGAAAALDILSKLAGKDVQDWDSPPKD